VRKIYNILIFVFIFIFFLTASLYAFKIKKIIVIQYKKDCFIISIFYKDFPFQQLVLALKRQKEPIFIIYNFSLYKKRFLKDKLLYKAKFYHELFYDPETNFYYVKDNFETKKYTKAEDAILSVRYLDSYPFYYTLEPPYKNYYLKIEITLFYKTHFSQDLTYTSKVKKYKISLKGKYDFESFKGY